MADKTIRTIGVLTSGGDAPGMNAAIRAVVRTALSKGLRVRGIRRGYQGLLDEEIIDLSARDVSDTIQLGGTVLQTARCSEMRTEEGQQRAAAICKKYGIDLPIINQVNAVLFEGQSADQAVKELMLRDKKIENSDTPWE